MANQTSNLPRLFQGPGGPVVQFAVDANVRIFTGMAVMASASNGAAIPCTPTASAKFLGITTEEVNNLTGSDLGGAVAADEVAVQTGGPVELTVAHTSTWARTDVQAQVYASDGSTFTLSAGTNNVPIGKVLKVPEAAIGAASAVVLVQLKNTAF